MSVTITGLAFCPCPPLLVPAVASGAAPELDDVRSACDQALRDVLSSAPDGVLIVGEGATRQWYDGGATGSFAAYGLELEVRLDPANSAAKGGGGEKGSQASQASQASRAGQGPIVPMLPLPLTVGAWLLGRSGYPGERAAAALTGQDDLDVGQFEGRWALLVMGDGSNSRADRAPGSLHPEAENFDAQVAQALERADVQAVLALDAVQALAVGASGLTAWRASARLVQDQRWTGRVSYDGAPYGVGYLVATWLPQH